MILHAPSSFIDITRDDDRIRCVTRHVSDVVVVVATHQGGAVCRFAGFVLLAFCP